MGREMQDPPASGDVAIYTENAKAIRIVRKVVLRMTSLLNWIPQ